MEYKIFGPGGTPSEEIRNQLGTFLKLDEAQKRFIAEVLLSNGLFETFGRAYPEAIAASPLLPEQFGEVASLVRILLYAWREYKLEIQDIERDLLLLGLTQSDIEAVVGLLKRLAHLREAAWASQYRRAQQFDGMPTIDNVNIVCDARAVFGGFVDGNELLSDSYKELLSITPLVIMEIISSDAYGQKQRCAFQMTDEQFVWLRKILGKGQEQLDILKERVAISTPKT